MSGNFWKWRLHGGRRYPSLATNTILFNSQYYLDSFLSELPRLLKHFPDHNELKNTLSVPHKVVE
jgi:hypothetical protein